MKAGSNRPSPLQSAPKKPPPGDRRGEDPDAEPSVARVPIDVRSAALTVLAVLAVILVLRYAQAVIIPIVLGTLASYALEPLVARLAKMHIPRPIGAALVLIAVVAATGTVLYQLRTQVYAVVDELPQAARRLRSTLENDRARRNTTIERVQKAADEIQKTADAAAPAAPTRNGITRVQVVTAPTTISDYFVWGSLGVVAVLGQLVLILFLTYFLLSAGDLFRRKIVRIAGPSLTEKKVTLQILEEIDRQIAKYLIVQVFTSVVVGVVTWLAFLWIGVEQAAVWGFFAGLFNSVPYIGPLIVTSGLAVVTYLQFGTLEMVATAAGIAFLITSLEGFLLTPWLTSRAARMNASAVFIGLIFWSWIWEVWGFLLAVPMLMTLKAVCDRVEDLKPVGELLGD
jgi:predicted PurR-regulated permease PerM